MDINAGVHANIGMDFQKNCTIYLFLEKYEELQHQKYFIALEHHEDVILGYLDNHDVIEKIETYQAKKSSIKWTISSVIEILKKITEMSQALLDDPSPKSKCFSQKNYFATNNTIELKCTFQDQDYSCIINEVTNDHSYPNLNSKIKDRILQGNKKIKLTAQNKTNLATLRFRYIDLSRTAKSQFEQLCGKFRTTFPKSIADHQAALQAFFWSLKEIESVFNQGNLAFLSDRSKRLESDKIEEILSVLTLKSLAYEFWRNKNGEICKKLKIAVSEQIIFQLHYENSFDNFKDKTESEHKKIYDFIKYKTNILDNYYSDEDCILAFYNAFVEENSTTLHNLQLKAVIAAAYFEIRNTL